MNIDEAIEVHYINDLDSTIEYLKSARDNGENIYVDFNSVHGVVRLYSADADYDNTYLRIFGLTKEEKTNYDNDLNSADNINEVHAKYQNMIAVYIDRLRDDSTKLEFKGSVYELIKKLNECKKLNKNIYIDYCTDEGDMPIRFYSMDLDIDREFLAIMGLTQSQYEEYKILCRENEKNE